MAIKSIWTFKPSLKYMNFIVLDNKMSNQVAFANR